MLAALPEAAVAVDPGRHLGLPHREAVDVPRQRSREEAVLRILAREALHRGARAHPTRIPADDVKTRLHCGREAVESQVGQELRTWHARTAGLVEERAYAPPRIT